MNSMILLGLSLLFGTSALASADLKADSTTASLVPLTSEEALPSSVYQDTDAVRGLEIVIDEAERIDTNFVYGYGGMNLRPVFPHRLRNLGDGEYKATGYFSISWTLAASRWRCDYPVELRLEFYGESNEYLDVSSDRPLVIHYPTVPGSCPFRGSMFEQFGFEQSS